MIDYRAERFEDVVHDLDVVFDTVGGETLERSWGVLKPGGRLVNIDWAEGESPVGPPARRRVPRAHFLRDARRAGLRLASEHRLLPYQYFFVLKRAR